LMYERWINACSSNPLSEKVKPTAASNGEKSFIYSSSESGRWRVGKDMTPAFYALLSTLYYLLISSIAFAIKGTISS
jgi:hypothetical protein